MQEKRSKKILISTHTPLAGRDYALDTANQIQVISTHTPLAGRDLKLWKRQRQKHISTHTPLAGRDIPISDMNKEQLQHFYSHAPCGT